MGANEEKFGWPGQRVLAAGASLAYPKTRVGNTLTKTVSSNTTTYAWDYENRLTSVTLGGWPAFAVEFRVPHCSGFLERWASAVCAGAYARRAV